MTHLAFEFHPDHDFIAARIDAELAAESARGTVIVGPWVAASAAAEPPDHTA